MITSAAASANDSRSGLRPYRWVVYAAAAVAVALIAVKAFDHFFVTDSWSYWTTRQDFLAEGGLKGVAKVVLVPHNGHVPLTFLLWIPLDWLFGMNSYIPYLVPVVVLHLVAGVLLFELLALRLRPAVATGAAALYLLMGNAAVGTSQAQYLVWMLSLPGILFGLLAIEWYGESRERRFLTVMFGIAFVTGALAVVIAAVLLLALLIRGRYRLAVRTGVVFVAVFAMWQVVASLSTGTGGASGTLGFGFGRIGDYWAFVTEGLTTTIADLATTSWRSLAAGLLILTLLVAGWSWLRDGEHVYVATAAGALFFYVVVGIRAVAENRPDYSPDETRYLFTAGALLLPTLAWLANRLVDLRRWAAIPLLAVLVWVLVGNSALQLEVAEVRAVWGRENRSTIETAASMVDSLGPLPDGILLATRSFRISGTQIQRLESLGKLPCVADYDQALALARNLGLPDPTPDQVTCD